jgi:hypothetical protein
MLLYFFKLLPTFAAMKCRGIPSCVSIRRY